MSNLWGDSASLYFFYAFLGLFGLLILYAIYRFVKNRLGNSGSPAHSPMIPNPNPEASVVSSRNSSVDKIFTEFNHSVNIRPTDSRHTSVENIEPEERKVVIGEKNIRRNMISQTIMEGTDNRHINALLNLLAVKETRKDGLKEDDLEILRRKSKLFTHQDLKGEGVHNNTTSNIENLSKSFCLNNDENVRNKPSCMFCLENVNIGDRVIVLEKCKHMFHDDCCLEWFGRKKFCPMCKQFPFSEGQEILDLNNIV